ncbi:hypothetical protein HJ590_02075 [Naumannella sp. ID2617S]|nr:hypothetical protein [Naumannella sp. ID2617S]
MQLPRQVRSIVLGATVLVVLGALVGIGSLTGTQAPLPIAIGGGLCLLFGLAVLISLLFTTRRRWYAASAAGLSYVGPMKPAWLWQIAWPELNAVLLTRGQIVSTGSSGLLRAVTRPPQRVRLILVPAGADFAEQHPVLRSSRGLDGDGTYGMALGDAAKIIPARDVALHTHAGPCPVCT